MGTSSPRDLCPPAKCKRSIQTQQRVEATQATADPTLVGSRGRLHTSPSRVRHRAGRAAGPVLVRTEAVASRAHYLRPSQLEVLGRPAGPAANAVAFQHPPHGTARESGGRLPDLRELALRSIRSSQYPQCPHRKTRETATVLHHDSARGRAGRLQSCQNRAVTW